MFNQLGYSVYLSNFEQMEEQLKNLYTEGSSIFTSFHISEEMDESYVRKAIHMCRVLNEIGYRVIGDVSKKTLTQFHYNTFAEFAFGMDISILRIDYGLTEEEIIQIGREIPICVNASTMDQEAAARIVLEVEEVYAMHNFYPRPETGLDREFFMESSRRLKETGMKILSFIPGDIALRGPLFRTLPTLEGHREQSPYAAWLDMRITCQMDGVFAGDGVISGYEADRIRAYERERIIEIPVILNGVYKELYRRVFTIRQDSPKWTKRLMESREYSCFGSDIEPENCIVITKGCITIDNSGYKRYSGEIQIICEEFPADEKVNVIGEIPAYYQLLLGNIRNSQQIRFVETSSKNKPLVM